jgi:hypothetical protein
VKQTTRDGWFLWLERSSYLIGLATSARNHYCFDFTNSVLHVFGGARFQLTDLSGAAFQTVFQFVPAPLVFLAWTDPRQIGLRQPLHLMLQADARLAQVLWTRLQFLR